MEGILRRRAENISGTGLHGVALVFAPHQDDETLGCGGVIALKRLRGVPVHVIFMCDGSRSHRNLVPGEQLRKIRAIEAVAACRALGVPEDAITFLDYEESAKDAGTSFLSSDPQVVDRILELLLAHRPHQVYIPYHLDQHIDHRATNEVVQRAVERHPHRVTVFEYPIWYWNCWPFTLGPRRTGIKGIFQRAFVPYRDMTRCGFRLLKDLNARVPIQEVVDIKRQALAEHKSQTTRLIDTPRWKTLYDTSNGDFVARFLGDFEWFRCYEAGGNAGSRARMSPADSGAGQDLQPVA